MKKLLSLLLAAILLCSLCGATALAEKYDEIFGEYTLVNMLSADSDEDMTEMVQAMAALGMKATLVVNEDGSAVMDMFGEQQELTFDFDAQTVTDGEDAIPYSFNGEELIIGTEEQGFVFSKAGIELPERSGGPFSFYLLTELLDENGEDYLPEVKAECDEDTLFGLYLFKDGSCSLVMYDESEPGRFDFDAMTLSFGEDTLDFTLDGEVLSIVDTDGVVGIFTLADPGFVGPYVMTAMVNGEDGDMSEQLALLEAVNMLPTLVIDEDGKGVLDLFDSDMEMVFDFEAMMADIQGEKVPFTYDKGVIEIGDGDQYMSFARVLPEADEG